MRSLAQEIEGQANEGYGGRLGDDLVVLRARRASNLRVGEGRRRGFKSAGDGSVATRSTGIPDGWVVLETLKGRRATISECLLRWRAAECPLVTATTNNPGPGPGPG